MGFFSSLFGNNKNNKLTEAIKDGAFLVDVRSKVEFSSGSVQGAVNIPVDQITIQINKFNNKKNIVVFCKSGMRSGMAKTMLEQNGFKNVINGGTWNNVKKLVHE